MRVRRARSVHGDLLMGPCEFEKIGRSSSIFYGILSKHNLTIWRFWSSGVPENCLVTDDIRITSIFDEAVTNAHTNCAELSFFCNLKMKDLSWRNCKQNNGEDKKKHDYAEFLLTSSMVNDQCFKQLHVPEIKGHIAQWSSIVVKGVKRGALLEQNVLGLNRHYFFKASQRKRYSEKAHSCVHNLSFVIYMIWNVLPVVNSSINLWFWEIVP